MGAFDHLLTDKNSAGWYGPVTSTIDWCELNHTYSYYIAEFINTLTNVPGILAGLYAAYVSIKTGVPTRYALMYLGNVLIGIGSFGFHASLKWEWQLMDELPMIYVASWAAYLLFDTLPGFKFRGGNLAILLLIAWDVFVTVSYISLPNPVYHQVAFATIMLLSIARAAFLLRQLPQERRSKLARTLTIGVLVFVSGFGIWNLDNYFCTRLRATREWLGDHGLGVLGHLTEGHGWWHILTTCGAFNIFTACIELCLCIKTNPYAYDYNSDHWIPIVRPVEGVELKAKLEDIPTSSDEEKPRKRAGNGIFTQ